MIITLVQSRDIIGPTMLHTQACYTGIYLDDCGLHVHKLEEQCNTLN